MDIRHDSGSTGVSWNLYATSYFHLTGPNILLDNVFQSRLSSVLAFRLCEDLCRRLQNNLCQLKHTNAFAQGDLGMAKLVFRMIEKFCHYTSRNIIIHGATWAELIISSSLKIEIHSCSVTFKFYTSMWDTLRLCSVGHDLKAMALFWSRKLAFPPTLCPICQERVRLRRLFYIRGQEIW